MYSVCFSNLCYLSYSYGLQYNINDRSPNTVHPGGQGIGQGYQPYCSVSVVIHKYNKHKFNLSRYSIDKKEKMSNLHLVYDGFKIINKNEPQIYRTIVVVTCSSNVFAFPTLVACYKLPMLFFSSLINYVPSDVHQSFSVFYTCGGGGHTGWGRGL